MSDHVTMIFQKQQKTVTIVITSLVEPGRTTRRAICRQSTISWTPLRRARETRKLSTCMWCLRLNMVSLETASVKKGSVLIMGALVDLDTSIHIMVSAIYIFTRKWWLIILQFSAIINNETSSLLSGTLANFHGISKWIICNNIYLIIVYQIIKHKLVLLMCWIVWVNL